MREKRVKRENLGAVHTHTHTHTHTLSLLKNKKEQRGITLIALVVTIVILLILAGITLIYVLGDNGILKAAQEAKNQTEAAMRNEQQSLAELANMLKEEYRGNNNQGGNTENPDTPTEPVETPTEEIKSDWSTIEKIAEEIAKDDTVTSDTEKVTVVIDNKKYTINAGDIFEVDYSGEVRRVRVLGFKHDDLVDQTVYGGTHTKASISFEFLDFMLGSTYMPIRESETSGKAPVTTGGWAASDIRAALNGYTTNEPKQEGALEGLGKNLNNKEYIKQVKKQYISVYNNKELNDIPCYDWLWLLSCSEVCEGVCSDCSNRRDGVREGSTYKYYEGTVKGTVGTMNTKRMKPEADKDKGESWWLRTLSHANGFHSVRSSDALIVTSAPPYASTEYGVAPGFCI